MQFDPDYWREIQERSRAEHEEDDPAVWETNYKRDVSALMAEILRMQSVFEEMAADHKRMPSELRQRLAESGLELTPEEVRDRLRQQGYNPD